MKQKMETRLWSMAGVLSVLLLYNTHAVSHSTVLLQMGPKRDGKYWPKWCRSYQTASAILTARNILAWGKHFLILLLLFPASCLRCFEKVEEIVENCSLFSQKITCELNSTANECKETKAAVVKYCSQNECNGELIGCHANLDWLSS